MTTSDSKHRTQMKSYTHQLRNTVSGCPFAGVLATCCNSIHNMPLTVHVHWQRFYIFTRMQFCIHFSLKMAFICHQLYCYFIYPSILFNWWNTCYKRKRIRQQLRNYFTAHIFTALNPLKAYFWMLEEIITAQEIRLKLY